MQAVSTYVTFIFAIFSFFPFQAFHTCLILPLIATYCIAIKVMSVMGCFSLHTVNLLITLTYHI